MGIYGVASIVLRPAFSLTESRLLSLLLDALHLAETRLQQLAQWLLLAAVVAAFSVHQLLAIAPGYVVASFVGLLLAILARRTAARSHSAALVTAALQAMVAGLLIAQALPVRQPLPLAVGALHGLFAAQALLALRWIARVRRAELDAARPVAMADVNMPGPPVAAKPARPEPVTASVDAAPPVQHVTRLPTEKQLDAQGCIGCPRCQHRQADQAACVQCGLDLARYWAAASRVRALEARLARPV